MTQLNIKQQFSHLTNYLDIVDSFVCLEIDKDIFLIQSKKQVKSELQVDNETIENIILRSLAVSTNDQFRFLNDIYDCSGYENHLVKKSHLMYSNVTQVDSTFPIRFYIPEDYSENCKLIFDSKLLDVGKENLMIIALSHMRLGKGNNIVYLRLMHYFNNAMKTKIVAPFN